MVTWQSCLIDLHPDKIPTNFDDYTWFAERWNGRVAMLAITTILILELGYGMSLKDLAHVLQFDSFLLL